MEPRFEPRQSGWKFMLFPVDSTSGSQRQCGHVHRRKKVLCLSLALCCAGSLAKHIISARKPIRQERGKGRHRQKRESETDRQRHRQDRKMMEVTGGGQILLAVQIGMSSTAAIATYKSLPFWGMHREAPN
jgi:hypothetical protein